jgi:hypothetical protein
MLSAVEFCWEMAHLDGPASAQWEANALKFASVEFNEL